MGGPHAVLRFCDVPCGCLSILKRDMAFRDYRSQQAVLHSDLISKCSDLMCAACQGVLAA